MIPLRAAFPACVVFCRCGLGGRRCHLPGIGQSPYLGPDRARRCAGRPQRLRLAGAATASFRRWTGLPPQVAAQIAAMEISQKPIGEIAQDVRSLQVQARDAKKKGGDDVKEARKPYRRELVGLAVEAQTRSLLRDLYSRNQLKEQLTWFWMNHFNVSAKKRVVAALVGDYEEHAIPPACAGQVPRPADRHHVPSGDAAVSGQCPECRWQDQRKLCPRDHGAAHHGRGFRLYPGRMCRSWRAS